MTSPAPPAAAPVLPNGPAVPVDPSLAPTPMTWRLALLAAVRGLTAGTYVGQSTLGGRGQAAVGIVAFFLLGAAFSANLRAVNWRTIGWGIGLQAILALAVIKGEWGETRQDVTLADGTVVTVVSD